MQRLVLHEITISSILMDTYMPIKKHTRGLV